jgi:hypothetical protein
MKKLKQKKVTRKLEVHKKRKTWSVQNRTNFHPRKKYAKFSLHNNYAKFSLLKNLLKKLLVVKKQGVRK